MSVFTSLTLLFKNHVKRIECIEYALYKNKIIIINLYLLHLQVTKIQLNDWQTFSIYDYLE